MTAYIIRRLLFGAVLIVFSTILSFTILKASPGSEIVTDDPRVSRAYIEEQARIFGLNQPAWKQYCNWAGLTYFFDHNVTGVLQGNLGNSFRYMQPVSTLIGPRLQATLALNLIALFFTWMLAIPLGTYASVKQYRLADQSITTLSFIGMSLPGFFLALVILWLFASKVQWLPPGGLRDPLHHDQMSGTDQFLDYLRHLIVPVTVLTFGALASLQRITRGSMLEVLGQQYVTTARAKGLSERKVVIKHALRNAINPLVTLLGFEFAALFGGAALLEIVINFPGMGQLLYELLIMKDNQAVMSIFLIGSFMLVLGNLLGDILLAFVDPRVSHA